MSKEFSQFIDEHNKRIAKETTTQYCNKNPEFVKTYGQIGQEKCQADLQLHLSYLAEAIELERPELFSNYMAWVKEMLAQRRMKDDGLIATLKIIQTLLQKELSLELNTIITPYIEAAFTQLAQKTITQESFITPKAPHSDLAQQYTDALLQGQRHTASKLILNAVDSGISVKDIYLHVFETTQHEIGRLWEQNKISVAQEHYCTAATQLIMSQLYPHIFSINRNGYKIVATCISGNLHEVGIRMVSDFFEMEGWDTYYLGANAPIESILETLETQQADILAISATLTAHVNGVKKLIAAVRNHNPTKNVKIMVGGIPFNQTPNLWRDVKADAHATNADQAIKKANELVGAAK